MEIQGAFAFSFFLFNCFVCGHVNMFVYMCEEASRLASEPQESVSESSEEHGGSRD